MKKVAVIQSRMTSTRLPGKAMVDIAGKSLTQRIIERAGRCRQFDEIVLAIPDESADDLLERTFGAMCSVHRGSLHDVLDRFWGAAKTSGADVVIRVTGDNPLVDPAVMDAAVERFLSLSIDYGSTSNCPLGIGAEVFTFEALDRARREAAEPYQREHVTPFFYEKPGRVSASSAGVSGSAALRPQVPTSPTPADAGRVRASPLDVREHLHGLPPGKIRLTVDTQEDLAVVREIYRRLEPGSPEFGLKEIAELYRADPELFSANLHVRQKSFKEAET